MGKTESKYEFHDLCQIGDIESVEKLLPTMTFEKINRQNKDGNTPLHLACAANHEQIIVALLNERDLCSRRLKNRQGKTPLACVESTPIRKHFSRPSESTRERFVEMNVRLNLQPIPLTTNEQKVPDDWMRGYTTTNDAIDGQFMLALQDAPLPLRSLLKLRTETEAKDTFEQLLQRCIERSPKKRDKLLGEYQNYKKTKDLEFLLNIYTCQSPVYRALQTEMNAFMTLIFLNLKQLVPRYYQGQTYRGAQMTQTDLDAYRWALNNDEFVLETRAFQSTSKSINVAQAFAGSTDSQSDRFAVLFTFQFDEKCPTAIDLDEISEFEDEEEVLVLPFTLFKIKTMNFDQIQRFYQITLMNILQAKQSFFSSWRNVSK